MRVGIELITAKKDGGFKKILYHGYYCRADAHDYETWGYVKSRVAKCDVEVVDNSEQRRTRKKTIYRLQSEYLCLIIFARRHTHDIQGYKSFLLVATTP